MSNSWDYRYLRRTCYLFFTFCFWDGLSNSPRLTLNPLCSPEWPGIYNPLALDSPVARITGLNNVFLFVVLPFFPPSFPSSPVFCLSFFLFFSAISHHTFLSHFQKCGLSCVALIFGNWTPSTLVRDSHYPLWWFNAVNLTRSRVILETSRWVCPWGYFQEGLTWVGRLTLTVGGSTPGLQSRTSEKEKDECDNPLLPRWTVPLTWKPEQTLFELSFFKRHFV